MKVILLILLMLTLIHQSKLSTTNIDLCQRCKNLKKSFNLYYSSIEAKLLKLATSLCSLFIGKTTCSYYVYNLSKPAVRNTIDFFERTNFFCSKTFCAGIYSEFTLTDFERDISNLYPKPKDKTINSFKDGELFEDLKILVINDIHIQANYKTGANIDCNESGGCCSE